MSVPNLGVPKFLQVIEPYLDIWPALVIRYSALKKSNHWYNLSTSGELKATSAGGKSHTLVVDNPLFRVGEAVLDPDGVVSFIQSLSKPELEIGTTRIRLLVPSYGKPITFEEGSLDPYTWTNYQRNRAGEFVVTTTMRGQQDMMLVGSGNSTMTQFTQGGEWEEIHRLLAEASFLDYTEFGRDYLRWAFELGQNSSPGVQIVAPLYSAILEPRVVDPGRLEVGVTGPPRSRTRDYVLTAVRRRETDEPLRGPLELVEKLGTNPDEFRTYTAILDTRGIYEVDFQLAFRRNVVDLRTMFFWTPESGNANYRVFQSLEDAEARLEKALSGKDIRLGENSSFDIAVSWVLQLCGFEVLITDLGPMKAVLKAQDTVDLIAMNGPNRKALVVETTTGSIDENHKLSKVDRRAAKVRGAVPEYDVLPVVANLDRSFDLQEGATAKTYGISVIGLQELVQLKWLAKQVTSPSEIVEYLRKQIPQ